MGILKNPVVSQPITEEVKPAVNQEETYANNQGKYDKLKAEILQYM